MRQILLIMTIASTIILTSCATSSTQKKELTNTERARLLVDVSNGALLEGDPTGALQNLAQAEQLDPSLPELHHSKALAYFAKHDLKTAITEARRAVTLAPGFTDANNTLGKLLLDDGRYEEAEPPLLQAANNPLYRDAYKANTNLGILFYRKGEYGKAKATLERAIEEAPASACIAHYYLGHIQLRNGALEKSLQEYEHATLKFCAKFGDAHLAVGMLFERNKEYDRARKKYLDIKQSFPNTKIAEQAMERLKYLP